MAGKHPTQAAPSKPKDAPEVKQPPLNSEPTKKPTSGVPKPDQAATDTDAATAAKTKVEGAKGAEAAAVQR